MAKSKFLPVDARQREHLVVFDAPDRTVSAVKALRRAGFEVRDVYTPFAVHGLDEALGLPESKLPWATLFGGATGCLIGLVLQIWTHSVDWPLNIGGKSNVAFPGTVPVMFELTILLAAFGTVGGLFVLGKLFPRRGSGAPHTQPRPKVSDDEFVVVVAERDGAFSWKKLEQTCAPLHPKHLVEGWRGQ